MTSLYQNNSASRPSASLLSLKVGGWLLSGLGIGAIIMYFLDPEAGSDRRESALNLAHQAGEQLTKVKSSVMNAVNADCVNDTIEKISDAVTNQVAPKEESSVAAPVIITAIACSLLGAAAMYLMDPDAGRRRRHYLRDQATSTARSTADMLSQKSRHLRNKAQGMYHDASETVRSQAGRLAPFATDDNPDSE